jgi:hypothetical protein
MSFLKRILNIRNFIFKQKIGNLIKLIKICMDREIKPHENLIKLTYDAISKNVSNISRVIYSNHQDFAFIILIVNLKLFFLKARNE